MKETNGKGERVREGEREEHTPASKPNHRFQSLCKQCTIGKGTQSGGTKVGESFDITLSAHNFGRKTLTREEEEEKTDPNGNEWRLSCVPFVMESREESW